MKLSPERRRTYIAVLTFVGSVVLLGLVMGFDGNWDCILGLFWIVLMLGAVGGALWLFTRFFASMTPELGKNNAIYSEQCSVIIGFRQYYWLVTRVSVYENLLAIKSFELVTFRPQDIWNLKRIRYGLKGGIQILHTHADVMRPVIILSWNSTLLQESIETGLHLCEMPHYGKEPPFEGLSEQERQERKKYPWLQ